MSSKGTSVLPEGAEVSAEVTRRSGSLVVVDEAGVLCGCSTVARTAVVPLLAPTSAIATVAEPPADGGGGGGNGGDGLGGGDGRGEAIVMMGSDTIVMPSAVEADAASPRLDASEDCISVGFVEAGTSKVAVMTTLPASTAMLTSAGSMPAAAANFSRRREVSA